MTEATNFGLGVLLLAALLAAILFQTNYRKVNIMQAIPPFMQRQIEKMLKLAALKSVLEIIDALLLLPPEAREAQLAEMRQAVASGDVSNLQNVTFKL